MDDFILQHFVYVDGGCRDSDAIIANKLLYLSDMLLKLSFSERLQSAESIVFDFFLSYDISDNEDIKSLIQKLMSEKNLLINIHNIWNISDIIQCVGRHSVDTILYIYGHGRQHEPTVEICSGPKNKMEKLQPSNIADMIISINPKKLVLILDSCHQNRFGYNLVMEHDNFFYFPTDSHGETVRASDTSEQVKEIYTNFFYNGTALERAELFEKETEYISNIPMFKKTGAKKRDSFNFEIKDEEEDPEYYYSESEDEENGGGYLKNKKSRKSKKSKKSKKNKKTKKSKKKSRKTKINKT
jgi:hypothetical protein